MGNMRAARFFVAIKESQQAFDFERTQNMEKAVDFDQKRPKGRTTLLLRTFDFEHPHCI